MFSTILLYLHLLSLFVCLKFSGGWCSIEELSFFASSPMVSIYDVRSKSKRKKHEMEFGRSDYPSWCTCSPAPSWKRETVICERTWKNMNQLSSQLLNDRINENIKCVMCKKSNFSQRTKMKEDDEAYSLPMANIAFFSNPQTKTSKKKNELGRGSKNDGTKTQTSFARLKIFAPPTPRAPVIGHTQRGNSHPF